MTKYWKVKVPEGYWMAGTHRFGTKRQAEQFVTEWLSTFAEVGPSPRLLISNYNPRREREQAMRDLGLVKVRGALGGTYWE